MTDKLNGGPMTLLNDCVNNPTRVKVYIRRRDGLRSILTGFVVAFDHHFNLVLRDVDEIYYRLKTKKAFFRNDGKFKKTLFTVPEVLKYDYVSRLDSNHEILQRHLNQILVTGDNVVLIATNS